MVIPTGWETEFRKGRRGECRSRAGVDRSGLLRPLFDLLFFNHRRL